jgi:tetratricopeptide (TPR) repeat protein
MFYFCSMGWAVPRRALLGGLAACAGASAASFFLWRGYIKRSRRRDKVMRYEEGLAALFERRFFFMDQVSLAHIAGFGHRLPDWLSSLSPKGQARWPRLFEAMLTGQAEAIEAVLRLEREELPAAERARAEQEDLPIEEIVDALALLGRGNVVAALHANALQRRIGREASSLTARAALSLARSGDWNHALEILELAARTLTNIHIDHHDEGFLWTYAYLHRRIDDVLPVLARMPFRTELPHLVAARAWKLKAYRIRAGVPGIEVPVIEGEQPYGYVEAAAMLAAAREDDPVYAELVQRLRQVLQPQPVEFIHADRGIGFMLDSVGADTSKAAARMAASRKDYAKAAALARRPSTNILIRPAEHVIDAFLEEGDWRGAAEIAKEHDPRRQPVIKGLDDNRVQQFVDLYVHLAFAAAYNGDDDAAIAFLDQAEEVDRTEGDRDEDGLPGSFWFLRHYTHLAGAREGLLPRRYLHLLGPKLYFL